MESAVRMAVETAESAGAGRVLALRLRVGALSGVVPEAMHFAFEVVCEDTIAKGARLDIETIPAVFRCHECREEFESDLFTGECPRCHSLGAALQRGRELEIASVEID